MYMYIYSIMKKVCPPWLSPQWLCGNSCTWGHDIYTPILLLRNLSTLYKYIYTHKRAHTHTHIYIYTFIYIHIYTHTHTHTDR